MYVHVCAHVCLAVQAKVMDRDGMEKMECPKGWPYIANMASTNVRYTMYLYVRKLLVDRNLLYIRTYVRSQAQVLDCEISQVHNTMQHSASRHNARIEI